MLARTTLGKETGGVVAREAARMPSNEPASVRVGDSRALARPTAVCEGKTVAKCQSGEN